MTDIDGSNVPAPTNAALIVSPEKFNIVPYVKEEFVVQITNVSFDTVLFRMLTTNPLRYLVKPRKGVIKPNASISLTVMLNRSNLNEEEIHEEYDDFRIEYCVIGPNDVIEPHCANVSDIVKARKVEDKRQVHLKKFRCRLEPSAKAQKRQSGAENAKSSPLPSAATERPASPRQTESSNPSAVAAKMDPRELEVSTLAEKNRRAMAQKEKEWKTKTAIVLAVLFVLLGMWFMSA
ncbi:hypothetical protein C3747_3g105 [Trypanosoma cruzi]|uniref:MSP domain-containing protein n=2 Tax=Trypanosoma cruzi TaxID=5693 RepID=Q4E571_TRYCC|nr:hypothetical protein, conserved [Trypanosoma cruzi]EAN99904.1 hypothetical protein, conserved [Trypanosoma cruzi]PWV21172.1 hypothetical protein C3747_3g105 [Trypanosoma cruzi]RNC46873.1 hypothetical protein TcCL_NonESM03261 [Trypanosoma cruzi]|eukprot:XP_821755.1 hypothetical protein [Trypanosoma cruzi strain CL Brener]